MKSSKLSKKIKKIIYSNLLYYGKLTHLFRLMPTFLIIGGQKCGTTSLYNMLIKHPSVVPALIKEVHYFDINFNKGIVWYKGHFPTSIYKSYIKKIYNRDIITGEASPYYLFHPHVPKRVFKIIPHVKLLILLRNPIDRAYSHYNHELRRGIETLSFEEALEREQKILSQEIYKITEKENYNSFVHQHYSYLSRGIYVNQLKNWMSLFPKEQFMIIKSEDFFNDTSVVFKRVLKFLELPTYELKEYKNINIGKYKMMELKIRKKLIKFFEPYNHMLYDYLCKNFNWDV